MTKELGLVILPAAGWFLFSLGGTGYKWARRYILPLVLGLSAFLLGIIWYRAIYINYDFVIIGISPALWRKNAYIFKSLDSFILWRMPYAFKIKLLASNSAFSIWIDILSIIKI